MFALFDADRVELTEVHCAPEGDAVVPAFEGWREVFREEHAEEGARPGYSFVTLVAVRQKKRDPGSSPG